jgi:hypothetical protein
MPTPTPTTTTTTTPARTTHCGSFRPLLQRGPQLIKHVLGHLEPNHSLRNWRLTNRVRRRLHHAQLPLVFRIRGAAVWWVGGGALQHFCRYLVDRQHCARQHVDAAEAAITCALCIRGFKMSTPISFQCGALTDRLELFPERAQANLWLMLAIWLASAKLPVPALLKQHRASCSYHIPTCRVWNLCRNDEISVFHASRPPPPKSRPVLSWPPVVHVTPSAKVHNCDPMSLGGDKCRGAGR